MSDGGKGSSPRPFSVDQKTFENNWDAIFGKKKEVEDTTRCGVTATQQPPNLHDGSSNLSAEAK